MRLNSIDALKELYAIEGNDVCADCGADKPKWTWYSVCVCVSVSVCLCVMCVHACVCLSVYTSVCVHVCMYVHAHLSIQCILSSPVLFMASWSV